MALNLTKKFNRGVGILIVNGRCSNFQRSITDQLDPKSINNRVSNVRRKT